MVDAVFQYTSSLALLYLLIIIGVSLSRVYLGVHSLYDVLAGTLLGVATVFFWRHQIKNGNDLLDLLKHWMLFTIPMFLYLFFELQFDMPPVISKAAGFLMSLAVILHTQGPKICDIHIKLSHANIYLTVTLCLFALLPQFKTHLFLHHFSNVLRFSFVVGMIFFSVPKIDSIIRKENSQKHLLNT
ncbi:MAG: phosphatase PAP2 family protein [Pseudomonadota bacterium]|nr:phosphatase PAP2 family protein [Pseudomonadota bacterium]